MSDMFLLQIGPEFLFSNIWVILILLLLLIPMTQRRVLDITRRRLLVKMGKKRQSVVITLIHRQETLSFLGIPLARYIDVDDSEAVLRAIRTTPGDVPIDLILHTPGGLALAATQIALALKAHPAKKTVIIPHYAMSGGTLIALAVDEIIMDPHAAMGPIDPQLGDYTGAYAATSLVKLMERKDINEVDDKTIVLADQAQKALDQMESLVNIILKEKCDDAKIEEIIQEFVSGKYTHDHPFMAQDTKRLLGDCVSTDVPDEAYELMNLYQMEVSRKRPGVEYVPVAGK